MVDHEALAFKVNGAPPQSNRLAAAQSVERRKNDAQFENVALDRFKQTIKLLMGVKPCLKDAFFRTFEFIRGIAVNCTDPKSVFPFISSYLTNSKAETHRFK